MNKWLPVFLGFSLLSLLTPGSLLASYSQTDLTKATASAQVWLTLIDIQDYEKSYAQGSSSFRNYVSHDKWVIILKSLRAPMGKMVSRKLLSHDYLANGLDGDEGEHILLHYQTTFSDASTDQLETVSLRRDDDNWVPTGYHFQAKIDPDDNPTSTQ